MIEPTYNREEDGTSGYGGLAPNKPKDYNTHEEEEDDLTTEIEEKTVISSKLTHFNYSQFAMRDQNRIDSNIPTNYLISFDPSNFFHF